MVNKIDNQDEFQKLKNDIKADYQKLYEETYNHEEELDKVKKLMDKMIQQFPKTEFYIGTKHQKISFIKIPGATELAIKANYLYTNNVNDLVVIDLSNIASPQVVSRVADAFPQINQNYPSLSGVRFECPDPSKGIVIGWEQKLIDNPKCRR